LKAGAKEVGVITLFRAIWCCTVCSWALQKENTAYPSYSIWKRHGMFSRA